MIPMTRHYLILSTTLLIMLAAMACTTSAYGVVVVVVPVQRQVTTTTATPQLPDPTPTQEVATFPTPPPLVTVYNPTESRWAIRNCGFRNCDFLRWFVPGETIEADLTTRSGDGYIQVFETDGRPGWVSEDGIAVWPEF